MKKIALILALVLVFACALVACDTEETNSTPANESSVVENNSEEIENTESSAPDEDSVPEESNDAPAATIEGTNVAAGKAYTTSLLYRQRNVDPWDYDETADIAYPDTDNKELTDGVVAEAVTSGESLYTAAEWIGLHGRCPDYETNGGFAYVTVDLGEKTDVKGVKVYVGCGIVGGGISAPSSVEIMVSDDGENWTSVAAAFPANLADTNVECVEIPCAVNGQYVQVRFTSGGWIFVSEVEIFA